jgi:carboxyl-terminal processing protease
LKIFFICVLICFSFFQSVQAQDPVGEKAFLLTRVIRQYHISPRAIDDSFSAQVYRSTLEKIDPNNTYFTAQDLVVISSWKYKLDEEIQLKSSRFLQELFKIYEKELKNADQTIRDLLTHSFSFSEQEFLNVSMPPLDDATLAMMRQRWKKIFKWRTLEMLQSYTDGPANPITPELIKLHEPEIQRKLLKQWGIYYKNQITIPGLIPEAIEEAYLSAIANCYDPHTEFMRNNEKKQFEEGLSSETMAFGFNLEADDEGNYQISDIAPGSSAFQSNAVYEKDKIISIKTVDGKTTVIKDATVEEINNSLGARQQSVELTLQSPDGLSKTVKLNKSTIRNEENIVRGWILEGEHKIGYISLPVFYTRIVDGIGTSCAEDVAREIVKLKKENIEALILDLRYNGGGSIDEAASLLGIFVDLGPIGMLRLYNGTTEIIKDNNRGQIWSGPMTVMINGASASASELVAATLQDYKKVLIAGSASFGKATIQIIIPVDSTLDLENDSTLSKLKEDQEGDFVKVTIGKIYRINGSSAQKSGITPDLHLPDRFELLDITERAYPTALFNDTVMKKLRYTVSPPVLSSSEIHGFEEKVVLHDPYMQNITRYINKEKNNGLRGSIPLSLEGYNAYIAVESESDSSNHSTSGPSTVHFKVKNSKMDADFNALEKYQKENDESIIRILSSDAYLNQAYELMIYILNLKK